VNRLGGNGQHRHVAFRFDLFQLFHYLETVHAGHAQIEQNQVVVMVAMKGSDAMGILCRGNAQIAGPPQHLLEQLHIGELIINNQNAGIKNVGVSYRHRAPSLF